MTSWCQPTEDGIQTVSKIIALAIKYQYQKIMIKFCLKTFNLTMDIV